MLGSQTVTVRNYTTAGRDRLNAPIRTAVDTVITGCAMQPVSVTETVGLTDVASEMWKCYLPPVAAALEATTASEIIYNSQTFQVIVPNPQIDLFGYADHVLLDLKRQVA